MTSSTIILGIESSCDDTAAAVVRGNGMILSNIIYNQTQLHAPYRGVVPEVAARAHGQNLDFCIEDALDEAKVELSNIDAIAVTAGPGLIGGVLSGVTIAKALAAAANKPFIGINHLAGHALTPRLCAAIKYPYLMLLASGGHCQFIVVRDFNKFIRIGGTIDDAPGEAFDKSARLLGLSYPGGPAIEKEAHIGNEHRFALPLPLLSRVGCDMSFSGLKTALLRTRDRIIAKKAGMTMQDRADLCASFQRSIGKVLAEKSRRACEIFDKMNLNPNGNSKAIFTLAGGVGANNSIRKQLKTMAQTCGFEFYAPPPLYCTDNAAMIAWAGYEHYCNKRFDDLTLPARARWPLDQRAPPMLGSGKRGAKA